MKNIFKYSMLMVAATMLLASCSDDRDSNPTLKTPESFVLNTPAYASQAIDLLNSQTVNLTWSQPDYGGFPVATSYTVEFSPNNDWSVSTVQAAADESGETAPTYYIVENSYTTCNAEIDALTIATALQQIMKYESENMPVDQKLYARVKASTKGAPEITSNVVELLVKPYYIELKPAPIQIWWLTGNFIATNHWTNTGSQDNPPYGDMGMIPMYPQPGADVDKDGNTILEYSGWFVGGEGFKIIAPEGLSNWNYGMCGGDETGGQTYRNGDDDPGDIKVSESGYYRIVLNTASKTMTMEKIESIKGVFTGIYMPGTFVSWDANTSPMTSLGSVENHDWYTKMVCDADGEIKFTNGTWDVNWGNPDHFPFGIGTQGADNIKVKAGTYHVYFNDISGIYNFIAVE
jgi:hypothetical protein